MTEEKVIEAGSEVMDVLKRHCVEAKDAYCILKTIINFISDELTGGKWESDEFGTRH